MHIEDILKFESKSLSLIRAEALVHVYRYHVELFVLTGYSTGVSGS